MGRPRSSALTVMEVLVPTVILAVLLAIFLPVIGSAREASRREQCRDNLRKTLLAVAHYESINKHCPAAAVGKNMDLSAGLVTTATVPGSDTAPYSWMTLVLPYVGEKDLYQEIDFSKEAFSPANRQHWSQVVPEFTCPSFSGGSRTDVEDYRTKMNGRQLRPALTQFVGMGATTYTELYSDKPDGALFSGRQLSSRDIVDGASKTIFITETREESYSAWADGTTASIYGLLGDGISLGPSAINRKLSESFVEPIEFGGQHARTWGPSSMHPGVAHVGFGDGGVRPATNDLDPEILRALITRGGDDGHRFGSS